MTADVFASIPPTAVQPHIYPDGWRVARLGEVCAQRGEVAQPPFDSTTAYVGLEHIDRGNPRLERWESASSAVSAKARFQPGDVLYGKLRPYLDKGVLAESDGVCSTDILVLKARSGLDSVYLSFVVHTHQFIDTAIQSTSGVTLPRTSWSALARSEFPLPPLPEQRAIARVLRAAQDAIAARRRQVTLERERKAALMQRLFTYGVRGEPTRQTAIGEMPQSWRVVRLGDMATLQRGFDLPESRRTPGKYPVMGGNGSSGYHSEYAIAGPGVCVGRSGAGGVGKVNWTDVDFWPLNTTLWVSDFHGNSPKFIYYRLITLGLAKYAEGATVPTLNRNLIHPLPVALPGRQEQNEISEILSACDAVALKLSVEVTSLEELFRAMLEELMSGRLSALGLVEGKEITADI